MADFPRASDRQDAREHKEVLDGIADVLTGARAANLSINGILTLLGLIFSGTARRITGDFHNATVANRVQFQDATAGAATIIGAIPNGVGTITGLTLANASDPDNAGLLLLLATSTEMQVHATKTGTGTYLPLALYTNGTKQVSIDAAGLLTLTQGQIAFPATQVPSAGVNVLDDYEEGTWTPSLGGSATYTARSGTYTKIGRKVEIQGHMIVFAIIAGSTTTISGLPFTAGAERYSITVGFWGTTVSPLVYMAGLTVASGTTIEFGSATAATAGLALNAVFKDGTEIFFSGTYFV